MIRFKKPKKLKAKQQSDKVCWLDAFQYHPRFEEFWAKHQKLVWWCARRCARRLGGSEYDYIGFLVLRMNRALKSFDESKNKFTTYFCSHLIRDAVRCVLSYESELNSLQYANRDRPESNSITVAYNTWRMQQAYNTERERDGLLDEIRKCFTSPESLWSYLCRGLSERDSDMLLMRFKHDATLEQIGDKYSITKERTRQLIERSLSHIRTRVGRLEDWMKIYKVEKCENDLDFSGKVGPETDLQHVGS
jgi:RNA polymerase sigma factor (sigma-70 family)